MIRSIVRYGNRTLHNPSEDVPEITPAIQTLITDMVETMHAESGVGLAAPQIGIPLRIFVADPSGGHDEDQLGCRRGSRGGSWVVKDGGVIG